MVFLTALTVCGAQLFPPAAAAAFVHHPKFNQFDTLAYGRGYQLYCKNPNGVTLTLTGKLPTTPLTRELAAGWHFLPTVNLEPRTLSDAFPGVTFDQALRYEPATGAWTAATDAHPGEALFLHVTAPSTWTPPLLHDPVTRFVYDGEGGRVKKVTPNGTTIYLGQDVEIDPDGTLIESFFVGAQRVASKDSRGTLLYYHQDHLGSSHVLTDQTGQIVQRLEYTPYGSLHVNAGTVNAPVKFTGQRLDDETGLYLLGHRYYDPALGRFIQPDVTIPDPGDPQSLNRYAYARNNPLAFTDPTGLSWLSKLVGFVAAAVTFVATGGNFGFALTVFSALDSGIDTYQRTGSVGRALAVGVGTTAASFVAAGVTNELALMASTKFITNRMIAVTIADTLSAAVGGAIGGGIRGAAVGEGFGRGAALGAMSSVLTYVALRAIEPALVKVDQSVRRLMSGGPKNETVATLELESLRGEGDYPIDSLNGHARLRYTPDGGNSTLYETYPDVGLDPNHSAGYKASASTPKARLTVSQDLKFREFISDPANDRWSTLGNCTCFTSNGWRAAGQPQINARSWLGIFNPNSLADTIQRRGD